MKAENVGAMRAVLDVSVVPEISGELRVVTAWKGNRVTVEYVSAEEFIEGDWERGLCFQAQCDSHAKLLESLERFLGRPVVDWGEVAVDIETVKPADPVASERFFVGKVAGNSICLPTGAEYEITSVFWRQIAVHGNWDPKRAFEEEEEALKAKTKQSKE